MNFDKESLIKDGHNEMLSILEISGAYDEDGEIDKEILSGVLKYLSTNDDYFDYDASGSIVDIVEDIAKRNGYEIVDNDGGYEGSGEYVYSVFKLGNKFYKTEWTYYSHYGYGDSFESLWDHIKVVTPKTVEVVKYV